MSNSDWHGAYWRDQRFPSGIDGRSYVRGRRKPSGDFVAARRHVQRACAKGPEQVVAIARLHKVTP